MTDNSYIHITVEKADEGTEVLNNIGIDILNNIPYLDCCFLDGMCLAVYRIDGKPVSISDYIAVWERLSKSFSHVCFKMRYVNDKRQNISR